jgi:hypothetical protein
MYVRMEGMANDHTQYIPHLDQASFLEIDEEDLDTSNLHARILSPSARHSLLLDKYPPTPHGESHIDASSLLQALNRLAPSVADSFALKSASLDALTFRLINDIDVQGEEQSYIILSCCWNNANHEAPRREESMPGDLPFGWVKTVERFPLPVSSQMFEAVLRERGQNEGLWFDQVCINQEDEFEKATAIGAIDTIYQNARTVIVALDDIPVNEEEAAFLSQYLDQYSYSDLPANQRENRGLSTSLMQRHTLFQTFFERVLSSIWFERSWCAPEMRMGRSHVFLLPCISEEDDGIFKFIRFTGAFFLHMLLLAAELPSLSSAHHAQLRSLIDVFARQSLPDEHTIDSIHGPTAMFTQPPEITSLVPVIAKVFEQKADGNQRLREHLRNLDAERDRISMVLSSAGLPIVLNPSSPSQHPCTEDECLRQLLLVGLAARDPVTLCTTGTPLRLQDGFVTWLSRPTNLDVPGGGEKLARFPEDLTPITQGSDGRAEYVQLDLIFLNLPHRSQPNPLFPTHILRARAVVELCIQYRLPCSSEIWAAWQGSGNVHARSDGAKNAFAQTLACLFDCGPQWLLAVSTSLQSSSHPPSPTRRQGLTPRMVEILCNPHLIIENYIQMSEGHHAFTLLLDLLATLITCGIPWASGATELTHGPLIVCLPTPTTSSASASSSPLYNLTSHPSPACLRTSLQQPDQSVYSPSLPQSPPSLPTKALIFAPFKHSKTLFVAIPDALTSKSYRELARAWILVPTGGYMSNPLQAVNWTLQGKSVIFGAGGFESGLERGGGKRRCHRVFGAGN